MSTPMVARPAPSMESSSLPTSDSTQSEQQTEVSANGSKEQQSMSGNPPHISNSTVALQREHRRKRLEIQRQYLERARSAVQDESHPDLAPRLLALQQEREDRLALAKEQEEYMHHTSNVIFDYECDEARSECMLNCEKLRQDMLDEIEQEIEYLSEAQGKTTTTSLAARKTTRKTRSTRHKNGPASDSSYSALDTPQKKKKSSGYMAQSLDNNLAESEVNEDLEQLTNAFEHAKRHCKDHATSTAPSVVRYHRGKLLYGDWILEEGDEVRVLYVNSGKQVTAILVSVTTTEAYVLSERGKYFRLVISDLRQGKIRLWSPLIPDNDEVEEVAVGSMDMDDPMDGSWK